MSLTQNIGNAVRAIATAITVVVASTAYGVETTPAPLYQLVMVEEDGCVWCERWNAEIAPAYPKSAEGQFAPLRRVDITAIPNDLTPTRRVNFTPTFLLVLNGQELARIEGYPGDNFFWPLLGRMLMDYTDFDGGNG